MPDNKAILSVRFGDGTTEQWTPDQYEQVKDKLYQADPKAKVERIGVYNPEEGINNNDAFDIQFSDGATERWNGEQLGQVYDKLMQADPKAQIIQHSDLTTQYWQPKKEEAEKALADFDEQNRGFMEEQRTKYRNRAAQSLTGMVRPQYDENDAKYDKLLQQREELVRAKYSNPLVMDMYESTARGAADRRNEYEKRAQSAADRSERKDWERAAKLEDDVRKLYEAPSKFDKNEENGFAQYLKNYQQGAVDTFSDKDFYTAGLSAIARNFDLRGIAKKLENAGDEADVDSLLTEGEKAQLMSFYNLQEAQIARAEDVAGAYRAGQSSAESLKFMAEFLLSQGFANVAGKAAAKSSNALVSWMGRQLMSNKALARAASKETAEGAKIAAGVARDAAKAAPVRIATQVGAKPIVQGLWHTGTQLSSLEAIADGMMNVDGNGDLVNAGRVVGTELLDQFVENWSESLGSAVEGAMPKEWFSGKTPFSRFMRWMNQSKPAEILGQAGFNGLIGEIGEEWAGNAVRLGLTELGVADLMNKEQFKEWGGILSGDKDTRKNAWEQQLEMVASFAPMTLFGMGTTTASALRSSKRYNETKSKVQGILERQDKPQEEIQREITDLLGTHFDTPEDIGKKLAPYLQQISEKAQSEGATEQDKEDYKTMLDFAKELGEQAVLDEMQRLEQEGKRNQIRDDIQSRVGRFWEEGDETVPEDQRHVRVVTDADGRGYYVTAADDAGVTGVDTVTGEHKFLNEGQYTEGETLPMVDYLQQQSELRDKDAEQARMQQEALEQINAVRANTPVGSTIPMGTESEPIEATVDEIYDDGVKVKWEAEGQPQEQILSWNDVASKKNTPIVVKTDAELAQDAADALDKAQERKDTYNKIPVGTGMVVDLEDIGPVNLEFQKATTEDGQVFVWGRDENGETQPYPEELITNLEDMLAAKPIEQEKPFKAGEAIIYQDDAGNMQRGIITEVDNGGGFTSVRLNNGTTATINTGRLALDEETPRDFEGNPLPMRENTATHQMEVDSTKLFEENPEGWVEWNDTNPSSTVSSEEKLSFAISALNDRIGKNASAIHDYDLRGGHDDARDKLDNENKGLIERRNRLQSLLDFRVASAVNRAAAANMQEAEQAPAAAAATTPQQYTQAPARTTYEDIYNDEAFRSDKEAYGFIQGKVAKAKAAVDKAQEALNKVQQQNKAGKFETTADFAQARDAAEQKLAAAQQELDYWNDVRSLADADIARAKKAEQLRDNEMYEPKTLMELVADAFIGFRNGLNKESFKKETGYSDADLKPFFQLWARNGKGLSVDGLAHSIAENDTFGLVPIDANGMKDVSAVKDAILEVFQQAKSPSDLYDYTYNANMARQQAEAEYIASQQEAPAEEVQQPVAVNEPVNVQPQMEAEQSEPSFDRTAPESVEQSQKRIADIVDVAKRIKDKVYRAVIAPITERQKQDFSKQGIDVGNDYVHSIENSAIIHNQNEHGSQSREEARGQIAIEDSDYELIPDILENYDTVEKSPNKNRQGKDVIIYTKTYPDGTIYYLEEVRDSRKSLAFQTMYKKKSGSGSSDGLMQDSASPSTPIAPSDIPVSVSESKDTENSEEASTQKEKVEEAPVQEQVSGEQGTLDFGAEDTSEVPEVAQQEQPAAEVPAKATKVPYHPDNLRKAYESGDKKQIAAAEKAMSEYIESSNSVALLRGTETQAKNRRRTLKKDTAEYKTQDFIAKASAKRLKELDKILPEINGMSAVKAYDAAFKTLLNRWAASKEELERAIVWYEQDKAAAQAELDALGSEAETLAQNGDIYVGGLLGRVRTAENSINKLRVELGHFGEELTEAQKNTIAFVEGKTPEQVEAEQKEAKRQKKIFDRVDKWKQFLGDTFEVLTSMEQIEALDENTRDQVKAAMDNGDTVHAWYNPVTDKVQVYVPNITDAAMLDRKILHEVVSHRGLRGLFKTSEDFGRFCDNIWDKVMDEEQRAAFLAYVGGEDTLANRRAAADEFLAHAAEHNTSIVKAMDENLWSRIVDALKNLINDMMGEDFFAEEHTWLDDLLEKAAANYIQERRAAEAQQALEAQAAEEKRQDVIDGLLGGESKAMETARAQENPQVPISRTQEKYEDFGEKIGMARKDIATSTGKKGKGDGRPAWMKKYQTLNVERVSDAVLEEARRRGLRTNGFVPTAEDITQGTDFSKPFIAFYEEKSKSRFGMPRRRYITGEDRQPIIFTSQEQYEATLPVFEAKDQGYRVMEKDGGYIIYRRASNNKVVEYAKFNTKEEAVAYLASPEGCTDMLNRKRENYELPALERLTRNNMPDYRQGKNITPNDILKTFGFRGGEFGNWLNAEERQQFLNLAYDALMDLSQMLGISPRALSLNGELSIAFGARGKAGSGAAAHYESTRAVINLTKMNGAGSLAHEWAHALDNYFGLMDAKRERIRDDEHGEENKKYLSEGQSYKRGARKEVIDAFREVMQALQKKTVTRKIETDKAQAEAKKKQDTFDYYVKGDRESFERGITRYQYNRKTKQREEVKIKPTAEQLAEFDRLVALLPGDPTFKWQYELSKNGFRASGEVAEKLYALVKDVSPNRAGTYGPLHNTFYGTPRLQTALTRLKEAQEGKTETVVVDTDFMEESKWFDRGRAGDYWTKDLEMFARAFETYLSGKMREQEQSSDYLTYMKGPLYKAMWDHNPYPAGEELQTATAAFDNLFKTIQERVDEQSGNTILFSKEDADEQTQRLFDAAKERFGTTRDLREAGYVLPDGSMLDFSGRHQVSGDSGFLRGERHVDHRDIEELAFERDGNTPTGIQTSMADFIDRGAIRIHSGSGAAINLAQKPTAAQQTILRRLIEQNDGDVWVDFGSNTTDHYAEYEGAKASRVVNDINRYFDEGYKPEGNILFSKSPSTTEGEVLAENLRFSRVTDPKLLEELNKGKTFKAYRAMALIDGKLYSPMATQFRDEKGRWALRQPTELGEWEQSDEHPEKAVEKNGKWVYTLKKPDGSTIDAAYNPYIHTSLIPLNDQFTAAHKRPELVIVEVEVPESELTSGYKAEKAKDAVGKMAWHAGPVAGQLPEGSKREVVLSRYDKPVRIVPDSEVADKIVEAFKGVETEPFPWNVFTPSLREELRKRGVQFSTDAAGTVSKKDQEAYEESLRYSKENNSNFTDNYGKGLEQNQTRDGQDGRRLSTNKARTVPISRDRSDIRVLEPQVATDRREYSDDNEGHYQREIEESSRLIAAAKANGLFIPEEQLFTFGVHIPSNTMESEIYYDVDNNRYIKSKNPFVSMRMMNGSPEEAIYQHLLHNIFFPETRYDFLGISEHNGEVRIILSQEGVNSDRDATLEEAETYLTDKEKGRGFTKRGKYSYENDEIIVRDLEGQNLLIGDDGAYYPIDPIIGNKIPAREIIEKHIQAEDVRFSRANENQRIFVSNAEAAVDAIPMAKATPQQWLKMIESKGGLKAGEDKWIGLSDWLKEQDAKTLTKEDVQNYIAQHQIQIEETRYVENNDEEQAALDSYIKEFDNLAEEMGHDEAWNEMVERYGEDFTLAFEMNGNSIMPQMDYYDGLTDAARYFMEQRMENPETKSIDQTRLEYTTRGLDNKAEIALTVPTIDPYREHDKIHFGDAGEGRAVAWIRFGDVARLISDKELTDDELRDWSTSLGELRRQKAEAEANIQRVKGRRLEDEKAKLSRANLQLETALNEYGFNTERVLFIDEIQSKRHQDARELGGYLNPELLAKANRRREIGRKFYTPEGITLEEKKEYDSLQRELYEVGEKEVGDNARRPAAAPFEKNWHELAMKRMLRYAAENGYDYVAWTTGDQQAERYSIGNVVDDVEKNDGKIYIDLKDGSAITLKVHKDGQIYESAGAHITPGEYNGKNLSDLLGKGLAQKVLAAEGDQVFREEGLRIGGEGMKGFYDQILPRFMDKYGKKWGVKTEDMQLPNLEGGITAHAVPVTEEMKESVMQGQVMFSKAPANVEIGGLPAVVGAENVREVYSDIYRAMPTVMRKEMAEKALGTDLNIHKALAGRLSEIAYEGYENDETGILRAAGKILSYYAGENLDEATARYILWRNGQPNDLLTDVQAPALKRRWGVGEDLRFSRDEMKDSIEAADKTAEATMDEAAKTLADGRRDLKDMLTATRAMRLQKEYDKKTIEAVTNLAKQLLKDQQVGEMSRREIARLLGLMRTSVGRSPRIVKRNADTIVEVVIDNLLKKEKAAYENLVRKTGTKTNATGVEVQGELDIQGQKTLKAYKEGLKLKVGNVDDSDSENTLYGMRAKVQSRLNSRDDAIRAEAEAEDAGLAMAIEYQEGIQDLLDEEKGLEATLDDLKAALAEGEITKKAYDEAVESTNDAIRSNHIDQVEAYRNFATKMRAMLSQSREDRAAFVQAEKDRVNEIHHLANSDLEGRAARTAKKSTFMENIANNSLVQFFTQPLGTFDQMLRLFGRKSVDGEGQLWNKFMGGWQKARDNEITGLEKAHKTLDDKASEVFGKKMKWSDLFAEDRKLPKATIRWWDDGQMRDYELTQGQLLYIYMVNKMADGRMKLRRMGIEQDHVDAIVRQMDDRFMTLADWLQEEYLVDLRNKYNAVHERLFGASMAAIDDYFPLKINKNALNRNEDIGTPDLGNPLPSTTTGSILKRKRNNNPLDLLNANAFDVVLEHIDQMEKWAAFAEFNKDINALISYKLFRNRVQNMATVYGSGEELWSNFRNVCEIVGGSYRPAGKKSGVDKFAVNLAKGATAAKINLRIYTAMKQFLSWPAFLADANPMYLAKAMGTPKASWDWAMENLPIVRERWRSRFAGETRLMKTDVDWGLWRTEWYDKASKIGMMPNAFVDALTVAMGAKAIYDTRYARLKKEGYTDEQADEKAKLAATVLVNETQQSSESAFVAPIQLDRTVFANMMTVYRNSPMGFQRQVHDALRRLNRHNQNGYRNESIEFMKKVAIKEGLSEEQAEEAAKSRYNRSIPKDLVRLAVFGFGVQFMWNLGKHLIYLLFGDDDDKKKEYIIEDALQAAIGGTIEGLTGGGAMSDALTKLATGENMWNYDPQTLPLFSDIQNLVSKMSSDQVAAANDLVNLASQVIVGVNPQTFTDAIVAVVDACNGDLDTSKEAMLLIMRVLQVPQSQLDELYIDELGTTARGARRMSYTEMAQRYADYKIAREAPLTGWAYSDEARKKREKSKKATFKKKVNQRKK